ncbi:hypothetical protein BKA66DRAFT_436568 [Pyrenochaeta sp. MPI-SDFR-AT-0127]|nr:hypothetical protein BKA66DRAFT_436568 [Pyrenochaeta sp. MPI-SDFR-AT-0127]
MDAFGRLLVHNQFYPPRLLFRTLIINSPQLNIRYHLNGLSVEKWGWVIYRCTYDDDETWALFRAHVEARSRKSIAESDAAEIANRLEWMWVEDAASLDRISTDVLRKRFRAWVADEVARQPGDYFPAILPRFRYFVKIDQEVLQSLAKPDPFNPSRLNTAFVKFVDGNWEPDPPPVIAEEKEEEEKDFWPEETLAPIGGCTEKDVGWMRIAPHMINADFYEALGGDENLWYVFYRRPPSIVIY